MINIKRCETKSWQSLEKHDEFINRKCVFAQTKLKNDFVKYVSNKIKSIRDTKLYFVIKDFWYHSVNVMQWTKQTYTLEVQYKLTAEIWLY